MTMRIVLSFCLVGLLGVQVLHVENAHAQRRKSKAAVREALPKHDELTLLYKPQLGTLLYDVETSIIHDQEHGQNVFPYKVKAEMAMENRRIEAARSLWTFDRFFRDMRTTTTKKGISGRDTLRFREVGAINRRSRVTYSMSGEELENIQIQPMQLSGDGQFSIFFLRPPRLLIPLPKGKVTYGALWSDTTYDTVRVRDTVNYLNAEAYYTVMHTYRFERLMDSISSDVAMITGSIDGTLSGRQMAFEDDPDPVFLDAPIHGNDTTYLNLSTGRVMSLQRAMHIPVAAKRRDDQTAVSEVLDVHSVVTLNLSNIENSIEEEFIRKLKEAAKAAEDAKTRELNGEPPLPLPSTPPSTVTPSTITPSAETPQVNVPAADSLMLGVPKQAITPAHK